MATNPFTQATNTDDYDDYFERDKLIYPDCIVSKSEESEKEISVKQYKLAKLFTWYRFDRAEGRLQITNKRVLFRATGKSLHGKTIVENEFAIDQIGGIEVRKGTIFSMPLFIVCAIPYVLFLMNTTGRSLLNSLSSLMSSFGYRQSINPAVAILAVGLLILSGSTFMSSKFRGWKVLAGFIAWAICGKSTALMLIASLVTAFAIFLFINRPNIVVVIKSLGAATGIDIRRSSKTEHNEYTGFDEVLPWDDADDAICELGAIINDIKRLGKLAIPKWQDAHSKERTPMRD